jgi:hypothetical protein
MRYGLLALSIAMLTSGGVAAQSALDISQSASATRAAEPRPRIDHGGSYGSLPFTAARTQDLR